jgi:hypothetical protein
VGDGLIVHVKKHHIVYPGAVRPEAQKKIVDPVLRQTKNRNKIEQAKNEGRSNGDYGGKCSE